ncbi:prolipoprotein diacylglyceryl transferase [Candidatus Woesearchaeota archaeon]|nr:prolipoprotein diacylglyceryl transferase [Candidatus Woesearchaeota archaeon]
MSIIYNPVKILFEFGVFKVWGYGLMLALAFLFGIIFALKEVKKRNVDTIHIYWLSLLALISAIGGGRLMYVLVNLNYFISYPLQIFAVWDGGLFFYGGLVSGIILFIIYLKINKLNVLSLLDMMSPSIALGLAITRIGCFLNWCCYGVASSLPWAVKVGNDVARHPTQIYSIIANFLIFLFLYNLNKRSNELNGATTGFFLVLYGGFRFSIDFIRYYESHILGIFSVTQIVSIILIIAGIVLLRKKQKI